MGVDCLNDGLYHPNVADFDPGHKIMSKDQAWDGNGCLYVDIFYPIELLHLSFCLYSQCRSGEGSGGAG